MVHDIHDIPGQSLALFRENTERDNLISNGSNKDSSVEGRRRKQSKCGHSILDMLERW